MVFGVSKGEKINYFSFWSEEEKYQEKKRANVPKIPRR